MGNACWAGRAVVVWRSGISIDYFELYAGIRCFAVMHHLIRYTEVFQQVQALHLTGGRRVEQECVSTCVRNRIWALSSLRCRLVVRCVFLILLIINFSQPETAYKHFRDFYKASSNSFV